MSEKYVELRREFETKHRSAKSAFETRKRESEEKLKHMDEGIEKANEKLRGFERFIEHARESGVSTDSDRIASHLDKLEEDLHEKKLERESFFSEANEELAVLHREMKLAEELVLGAQEFEAMNK